MSKYGSRDIYFTVTIGDSSDSVSLYTNIGLQNGVAGSFVNFSYNDLTTMLVTIMDGAENVLEKFLAPRGTCRIRVLYHREFVTIYSNGRWLRTYSNGFVEYPSPPVVEFVAPIQKTITSVRVVELSDWREAVWIDMESTAQSGISNIIQERPIEIFGRSDGTVAYVYYPTSRSEVALGFVRKHIVTYEDDPQASSDGLVYFTDVAAVINRTAARDLGWVTRMYRLSNLEIGAIEAAQIAQRRALENCEKHDVQTRPDIRLEVGDIALLNYELPGSDEVVDEALIVEDIQIDIMPGNFAMKVSGRGYFDRYAPQPGG